ncbi:MAG TPA: DNA polymerase [Fimbriiglobus sp.]|nr:DNA polymerase [Fimbriiglobus sp.]
MNTDSTNLVDAPSAPSATEWMTRAGVPFDRTRLAQEITRARVDAGITKRRADILFRAVGNDNNPRWHVAADVVAAFARFGITLPDTDGDTLRAVDHPLAREIVAHRSAQYRARVLEDVQRRLRDDGRVYPRWIEDGAITGRMQCAEPNLQGFPRDLRHVIAAPAGRVLVAADYAQIELVVAAVVSQDVPMLDAVRAGRDLHRETAAALFEKPADAVTDSERQLGKVVNFAPLYGMGAAGLARKAGSAGITIDEAQAKVYLNRFFAAHTALAAWIRSMAAKGDHVETLTGRRIPIRPDDHNGKRANYVIQGTAAAGFMNALALLFERRRKYPDAHPVIAAHDAFVIEAPAAAADGVAREIERAMIEGMKPVLGDVRARVETKVASVWTS